MKVRAIGAAVSLLTAGLVGGTAGPAEAVGRCVVYTDKPAVGLTHTNLVDAAFSYRCTRAPRSLFLQGYIRAQDASTRKKDNPWVNVPRDRLGYGKNPASNVWYGEKAPDAIHATGQLKVGKWRYILVVYGKLVDDTGATVSLNQQIGAEWEGAAAGWSKINVITFTE